MSVLDHLRKVKEDLTRRPHPFVGESESFRVFYVVGVAMMALSKDEAVDEQETAFLKNLVLAMGLGEGRLNDCVQKAKEAAENTIQSLIQSLQQPDQKYSFAFDLLNIMRAGSGDSPEGREKLNLFMDLLKFAPAERNFIAAFSASSVAKDGVAADKALVEVYENGFQPEAKMFSYFFPELVVAGALSPQRDVFSPAVSSPGLLGQGDGKQLSTGSVTSSPAPTSGERWFGPGNPG